MVLLSSSIHAETIKGVVASGACAIVGMSAEQCQLTALQRARAAAIEEAAGIHITATTLVTNAMLSVDYIKSYAHGFIIKEKSQWSPLGQYQKDPASPPIPEYRVTITADVKVPEKQSDTAGLKAAANATVYRSGDKAVIGISTDQPVRVAIFNITAADEVMLVFPNERDMGTILQPGIRFNFPNKGTVTELVMEPLPGHDRDAEAFLVTAYSPTAMKNILEIFPPGKTFKFSDFFRQYAELPGWRGDVIIGYEVVK